MLLYLPKLGSAGSDATEESFGQTGILLTSFHMRAACTEYMDERGRKKQVGGKKRRHEKRRGIRENGGYRR